MSFRNWLFATPRPASTSTTIPARSFRACASIDFSIRPPEPKSTGTEIFSSAVFPVSTRYPADASPGATAARTPLLLRSWPRSRLPGRRRKMPALRLGRVQADGGIEDSKSSRSLQSGHLANSCYFLPINRDKARSRRTASRVWHSHITRTFHPRRLSFARFLLSRAMLFVNLAAQYCTFDDGSDASAQPRCWCQKQPWTSTSFLCLGSAISGFPGKSARWSLKR